MRAFRFLAFVALAFLAVAFVMSCGGDIIPTQHECEADIDCECSAYTSESSCGEALAGKCLWSSSSARCS